MAFPRLFSSFASPFVGNAGGDAPAVAVEAGGRRRAARDVDLVGQIDHVQRGAPVLPFVVEREIAEHGRGNLEGIGGIRPRRTDIADTAAEAEPRERPVLEGVVRPARHQELRHVGRVLPTNDGSRSLLLNKWEAGKEPISFSSRVAFATASSSMPRDVTSPVWFCKVVTTGSVVATFWRFRSNSEAVK